MNVRYPKNQVDNVTPMINHSERKKQSFRNKPPSVSSPPSMSFHNFIKTTPHNQGQIDTVEITSKLPNKNNSYPDSRFSSPRLPRVERALFT